jgi:hypothetical protein
LADTAFFKEPLGSPAGDIWTPVLGPGTNLADSLDRLAGSRGSAGLERKGGSGLEAFLFATFSCPSVRLSA